MTKALIFVLLLTSILSAGGVWIARIGPDFNPGGMQLVPDAAGPDPIFSLKAGPDFDPFGLKSGPDFNPFGFEAGPGFDPFG